MRKGNQVKIEGKWPYCGHDGIVKYCWERMYGHLTEAEVLAWYDSPASKGINSAGETKLPPRFKFVEYNGGTLHRTNFKITSDEETKLSDDTFTVVRARCAPIIGYSKTPKCTLLRNNRTGEEGYIKRRYVRLVQD